MRKKLTNKMKNQSILISVLIVMLLPVAGCSSKAIEEQSATGTIETDSLRQEIEETSAKGSSEFLLSHLNCNLPDEFIVGDFDPYLGGGGGYPVLDEKHKTIGTIELWHNMDSVFEDGQLIGLNSISNQSVHSEFIALEHEVPCIITQYSFETDDESVNQSDSSWYVFWAQENMEPVYAVSFNTEVCNDEKDLEGIASSIGFNKGAFLTSLQMEILESAFGE